MIPPPAKLHVLIVDDEPRIRELLTRAVTEMGFEATTAGSAEQASRLLQLRRPHIVLIDLNLPGMDGLEFLQLIRDGQPPAPQVIILTGFGSLDAAKVAIRNDVADFLTKPCRLDELESAMARAQQRVRDATLSTNPSHLTAAPVDPSATLEALERQHILAALDRHNGNRAAAANELGISERTLYYRLARYHRTTASGRGLPVE